MGQLSQLPESDMQLAILILLAELKAVSETQY